LGFPIPTLGFIHGLREALKYLPIAIPFAILTVVGGINVTESARVAGDDFNTQQILLTEAFATLIAGLCGGVAQSTPYIGQPAYKQMGSRAGYTLMTGIFIGLGGILGYIGYIVELIPRAVLAPILIFVALDIMCQAFHACPKAHAPAVAFAYLPTVARLLQIKLSNPDMVPMEVFAKQMVAQGKALPELLVTVALGNGFILTAMLWGAFMAKLIDRKLKTSALYLFILAALSFVGIIHSASPDGNMYLPWNLTGLARQIPYQFTMAYVVLALMLFSLSFTKESREPVPERIAHGLE
jgi:AGZA family xanthine/uracil permease-like MFS transporter